MLLRARSGGLGYVARRRSVPVFLAHDVPHPEGVRRSPRAPQSAAASGLPEAGAADYQTKRAMVVGYNEAEGTVQVDVLLPLCHPRRLQSLCRRVDDRRKGIRRPGAGVDRDDLREAACRPGPARIALGSWSVDDLEERSDAAGRPGCDEDALPASRLERQSVLGSTVLWR